MLPIVLQKSVFEEIVDANREHVEPIGLEFHLGVANRTHEDRAELVGLVVFLVTERVELLQDRKGTRQVDEDEEGGFESGVQEEVERLVSWSAVIILVRDVDGLVDRSSFFAGRRFSFRGMRVFLQRILLGRLLFWRHFLGRIFSGDFVFKFALPVRYSRCHGKSRLLHYDVQVSYVLDQRCCVYPNGKVWEGRWLAFIFALLAFL